MSIRILTGENARRWDAFEFYLTNTALSGLNQITPKEDKKSKPTFEGVNAPTFVETAISKIKESITGEIPKIEADTHKKSKTTAKVKKGVAK